MVPSLERLSTNLGAILEENLVVACKGDRRLRVVVCNCKIKELSVLYGILEKVRDLAYKSMRLRGPREDLGSVTFGEGFVKVFYCGEAMIEPYEGAACEAAMFAT